MTEIDMPSIDFPHLFIFFILYAFVGWICEEIYCSSLQRKIVKRGMLFGPICPIYGFGALAILYILYPWRQTWARLFFASMVVTSILEFFTSWLLEKLFHAKWWDYSQHPFNLNGRVCLLNSTLFGIGGLALEHVMHPAAEKLVFLDALQPYVNHIAIALAFILAVDVGTTVHRLVDFAATVNKFKAMGGKLGESVKESLEELKSGEHGFGGIGKFSLRNAEKWFARFPSMTSVEHGDVLESLKKRLSDYAEQQKILVENEKRALKEKTQNLKKKKTE